MWQLTKRLSGGFANPLCGSARLFASMRLPSALSSAALLLCCAFARAQRIEVTIPSAAPLHGHLILVLAKKDKPEPRMQMSENYESAQAFGVDVDATAPGKPIVVDAATFGYPRRSLSELEAGDYFVQGVFNVYEKFHLATGKSVWLPPDKGEGQHWNRKPGNPYNAPVKLHFDPEVEDDDEGDAGQGDSRRLKARTRTRP